MFNKPPNAETSVMGIGTGTMSGDTEEAAIAVPGAPTGAPLLSKS